MSMCEMTARRCLIRARGINACPRPPHARAARTQRLEGGTYVVAYSIRDTPVRGVLDTGSPFLTMEGRCGAYWQGVAPRRAPSSHYSPPFSAQLHHLRDEDAA